MDTDTKTYFMWACIALIVFMLMKKNTGVEKFEEDTDTTYEHFDQGHYHDVSDFDVPNQPQNESQQNVLNQPQYEYQQNVIELTSSGDVPEYASAFL